MMPVKLRWQAPPFAGICHIYRHWAVRHCTASAQGPWMRLARWASGGPGAVQILVSPAPKWPSNPQGRTPRAAELSGLLQGRSTPTCAIMDSESCRRLSLGRPESRLHKLGPGPCGPGFKLRVSLRLTRRPGCHSNEPRCQRSRTRSRWSKWLGCHIPARLSKLSPFAMYDAHEIGRS